MGNATDAQVSPLPVDMATCDACIVGISRMCSAEGASVRSAFALSHGSQEPTNPTSLTFHACMRWRISTQGSKDASWLVITKFFVRHERGKVRVDDIVMVECWEGRSTTMTFCMMLMKRCSVLVPGIAHMLMVMAFVAGRAWSTTK